MFITGVEKTNGFLNKYFVFLWFYGFLGFM